jgi:hypothetical protein
MGADTMLRCVAAAAAERCVAGEVRVRIQKMGGCGGE